MELRDPVVTDQSDFVLSLVWLRCMCLPSWDTWTSSSFSFNMDQIQTIRRWGARPLCTSLPERTRRTSSEFFWETEHKWITLRPELVAVIDSLPLKYYVFNMTVILLWLQFTNLLDINALKHWLDMPTVLCSSGQLVGCVCVFVCGCFVKYLFMQFVFIRKQTPVAHNSFLTACSYPVCICVNVSICQHRDKMSCQNSCCCSHSLKNESSCFDFWLNR